MSRPANHHAGSSALARSAAGPQRRVSRPRALLAVAVLGCFMAFVDATIVNIAVPNIAQQRVEYTALDDTTNTASRLEGMTKGSGHMLFIADTTRQRMESPEDLVLVGEFEVRGRVATVPVWTIPAPR